MPMAGPRQPPAHDDAAAEPKGPWTEEEKRRGAGVPGGDAGAADGPSTKARPNDERARTEGAAANIASNKDTPPPDPDTVIVGGIGTRPLDGGAPDPEPEDPQAPRNPR
jgi:hypothetical protein